MEIRVLNNYCSFTLKVLVSSKRELTGIAEMYQKPLESVFMSSVNSESIKLECGEIKLSGQITRFEVMSNDPQKVKLDIMITGIFRE